MKNKLSERSDMVLSIKPEIPDVTLKQWQGIVDLMAAVCCVPAALIMKVHTSEIEVLISAKVPGNPYHPGEKTALNTGLYCETVMATRKRLLVPNALKDLKWDHVEEYISVHSEAQFSHGICPDCIRKLYPEYADEVRGSSENDEKK